MMNKQLVCIKLSKRFGSIKALDNLDINIPLEGATGLVGANGAGKSTLFSLICGFIKPSSGSIQLFDEDVNAAKNKGKISILPQDTAMFRGICVNEQLRHYARLCGLSRQQAKTQVETVLSMTGTADLARQYPETLSFGQRKRIMLSQALIHQPALILLDEPTSGLDPVAADQVRKLLAELSDQYSLIISSHNIEEIDNICNKIIVLNKGKLVDYCHIDTLKGMHQCLRVKLEKALDVSVRELIMQIENVTAFEASGSSGHEWIIFFDDCSADTLQLTLLNFFQRHQIGVAELKKGRPLLEEISSLLTNHN